MIEVDGYFYHNAGAENKNIFVNDRWKMNDAAVRGYLVLRYPASSVFEELDTIVGQVIFATRVVREELVVGILRAGGIGGRGGGCRVIVGRNRCF